MAFEALSERLNKAFRNVTGKGKLTEKNMNDMLKEVRISLLEADVNYKVVKNFIENVKEKALGTEVLSSLNPGQLVVKIVHDEIVTLLGSEDASLAYCSSGVTSIMMVGLQGTGKTTAAAKIANLIKKKHNKQPLLVACDLVRPAAIEQLQTLGNSIGVEVFSLGIDAGVKETIRQAKEYALNNGYNTVIYDTAGRLHIDDELMQELDDAKSIISPNEILLTVDAMTGQNIVQVAEVFHERLHATGLVVTKLDGDSRGGGVLSVKSVTNVPVKFVGLGEKIEDLDIFYPKRMADRILGMGDIVSLVEQAQEKMDVEATSKAATRMLSGQFTMDDMLVQFQQIKKMGSLGGMMKLIPGFSQMANNFDEEKAEKSMKIKEAIIQSMTKEERKNPSILKASRKNRIAKGSGTQVSDVNRLLSEFEKMKQVMKQMSTLAGGNMGKMGNFQAMKAMRQMQKGMGGNIFKGRRKF